MSLLLVCLFATTLHLVTANFTCEQHQPNILRCKCLPENEVERTPLTLNASTILTLSNCNELVINETYNAYNLEELRIENVKSCTVKTGALGVLSNLTFVNIGQLIMEEQSVKKVTNFTLENVSVKKLEENYITFPFINFTVIANCNFSNAESNITLFADQELSISSCDMRIKRELQLSFKCKTLYLKNNDFYDVPKIYVKEPVVMIGNMFEKGRFGILKTILTQNVTVSQNKFLCDCQTSSDYIMTHLLETNYCLGSCSISINEFIKIAKEQCVEGMQDPPDICAKHYTSTTEHTELIISTTPKNAGIKSAPQSYLIIACFLSLVFFLR